MNLRRLVPAAVLLAAGSALEAQAPGANMPIMQADTRTYIVFDELEYLATDGAGAIEYDSDLWWGGDINRLWFRAAGENATAEWEGDTRLEAMYSRALTSFWNLQVGARLDHAFGDGTETRSHIGAGVQGLSPYWFEVEAFVYIRDGGDLSARFEASYDVLLTQRLALESEVEANASSRADRAFGLGTGVTDVELGTRLRYEFAREFAPYIGFSWERLLGSTADLSRAAGEAADRGALVVGLHWWW